MEAVVVYKIKKCIVDCSVWTRVIRPINIWEIKITGYNSEPVSRAQSLQTSYTIIGLHTVSPLIEAGSLIQAGSLIEAWGSGEYHRANCTSPVALWCIASFVRIV